MFCRAEAENLFPRVAIELKDGRFGVPLRHMDDEWDQTELRRAVGGESTRTMNSRSVPIAEHT